MRYDIAIIGTGPAGVSAAITAALRNKTVLLLGSAELSPKMRRAHLVRNYPGLPEISGSALADAMKAHLNAMEIPVTEDRITAVYAMGDYFALQGENLYESRSVILASGIVNGKTLPGENELLGRGVSWCATCDASLYRGKKVVVIGYDTEQEKEADFLSEVVSEITYIPMYAGETHLKREISVLREIPKEIRSDEAGRHVCFGERTLDADGVFVLRNAVAADRLVPGLETEGPHVKTDAMMRTNLPGLFACGDIAGRPYQYVKSAGQGNIAALSAVDYLAEQEK